MDINIDIDTLLNKLHAAHKIVLNDDNMFVIKLHRNKIFSDWLTAKYSMPIIKQYHNSGKTYNNEYYSEIDRTNSPAEPLFITLGIIKNINSKKINISCCNLDIKRISNTLFIDNSSSGIIFNGSFFYLENHILHNMYGTADPAKIYNPIGFFHHNMDNTGTEIILSDKTDTNSLQPASLAKNITLDLVKNMLGTIVFKNDNTVNFIELTKYNPDEHTADQVLMGNLLISDGVVKMTEDKINTAVLLKPFWSFTQFTTGKLYNTARVLLSAEEINNYPIGGDVLFITSDDLRSAASIKFSPENIDLPFCANFLARSNPAGFAGMIPPGYPNHASDANPRTCAFVDIHNNFFVMNVEGRHNECGGIGMDLFDLAKICKSMGAIHAINLDGGGSSKLAWKEKNNTLDYVGLQSYVVSNAVVIRPMP